MMVGYDCGRLPREAAYGGPREVSELNRRRWRIKIRARTRMWRCIHDNRAEVSLALVFLISSLNTPKAYSCNPFPIFHYMTNAESQSPRGIVPERGVTARNLGYQRRIFKGLSECKTCIYKPRTSVNRYSRKGHLMSLPLSSHK